MEWVFFFELKEKPFIDIIIPGTTDGFLTKGWVFALFIQYSQRSFISMVILKFQNPSIFDT